MKKAIIIISVILVFLLLYFLQANFFNWFTIAGIKPNLFIILVLFIGLYTGRLAGISSGIVFGICLDLFIGKTVGMTSIMLGVIGFLGGYFDKNFSKESRITIMLMVMGATLLGELGIYILNAFLNGSTIEIIIFLKMIAVEIGYNMILTIIAYPILQKAGVYLEEVFKGPKILTRYF